MGVTSSNKQINLDHIDCDGVLKVTLALSASPDIVSNPTDIVLVLDRSGSMTGSPLANMKAGASTFIDIISEATGGAQDGVIGSGSRIGIVSFADTATVDAPLITSVVSLKSAVTSLVAGGSTNHADAFSKATQLFDPLSTNAKVMVMFTDGKTTAGLPPAPVAAAARASGIIIYCIGLVGSNGIQVAIWNEWATDPDASHVAVTPDDDQLQTLFENLAANISNTGATNIVIDEVVNPDFAIVSMDIPTKGTASILGSDALKWKIQELGVSANEGASLEFYIRHTAHSSGEKLVNQSITYSDNEGNVVVFPAPTVEVDCPIVIRPDCPQPVDLTVSGCEGIVSVNLGNTYLEDAGQILQLDVTIKKVCPHKRVALAVILTEVDANGEEHQRGMKTMTIPAHSYPGCRDILVECIPFILPQDLSVSGKDSLNPCQPRNLRARVMAHSVDSGYPCCELGNLFH